MNVISVCYVGGPELIFFENFVSPLVEILGVVFSPDDHYFFYKVSSTINMQAKRKNKQKKLLL